MGYYDFVGFTYNGYHSIHDLKIYRTSNGSRYDDNITATMTDKTVDVPGRDGQYYFGTTFKNRTFTVNYAFDDLTKEEIRTLKQVFCGDGIYDLIFDEDRDENGNALKIWSAKVTGTASMKYLCFEEAGEDVFKGEGSLVFTCYFPYARSENKDISNPDLTNDGDIPAPFEVGFQCVDSDLNIRGIQYYTNPYLPEQFIFSTPLLIRSGYEFLWNSQTGLIMYREGYGGDYIELFVSGKTSKNIPVGESLGKIVLLTEDGKAKEVNITHLNFCEYYR